MDPRVQAMADVLVNYSVRVKEDDWVAIRAPIAAEPLAVACMKAALRAGGNPTVILASDHASETMLREGNDAQLSFIPPVFETVIERADVLISFLAPDNTRATTSVDATRMALQGKAQERLMATYLERASRGELRWTLAQYPTNASAQDANMSLTEYEDFVYGAGLLSEPDPIAAWQQLGQRQERLVEFLKDKKSVHIKGPGTDLQIGIAGRTWMNDSGHENFPGGEVFTGPVEDSAEGEILFSFPASLRGREVTDVRLVFKQGKVVDFSATSGGDFLEQMLGMDEGARRLGELAFGSNYGIAQFSKNTLFDEKIGGTLHMALGRSYPETRGTNVSALHWDMVYNLRNGGEVTVDGVPFSQNGEFRI